MQEVFYEETVGIQNEKQEDRKYKIMNFISIFSFVILLIYVVLVLNLFEFKGSATDIVIQVVLVLIPAISFFATGFVFGRLKFRFSVDYDYMFNTGTIKVSKVIRKIRRVFFIKFNTTDIEKIGKCGSTAFNSYENYNGIEKVVLTANRKAGEGKLFYYIVANVGGNKKLLIFECTSTFIMNVIRFSSRLVLDGEFNK